MIVSLLAMMFSVLETIANQCYINPKISVKSSKKSVLYQDQKRQYYINVSTEKSVLEIHKISVRSYQC